MTTALLPICYQPSVGVTGAQIVPQNPSRKALLFFNPSANTVTIFPALNSSGQPPAVALNGAGGISVLSGGMLALPQGGWPDNIGLGSAWLAIASGASTPFTVWEF